MPGKDKDGKTKKYDAYTDIINRLTKTYGIPRKEIAYIQEAKNDKEKEALFQRVRDGEVRILIGGTKNMGTGVNVQTLISDLHMLSVPWQPASLEQCIGRGARQGNTLARDFMGNKVRVHYYATEGSLDLYKFQLLDAKGKMFTQFKMGTISGSRSFDEGSADEDGNLDPAEMVAILSGNPVIFEKAKHDKYVQKLKNLYNGFLRDEQRKATQYRQTEEHLTKMERLVRLNDSDVRSLESHGFRPNEEGVYPFAVEVILDDSLYGAKRFDKPKEAGMYILDALKNGKKVTLRGFGREANVVMKIADNLLENPGYELQSGDDAAWSIRYKVNLSADPTAAGSAFRNLLQQIIRNHDFYHRDLEETKERLSTMSKGDDVFSKQKELDEALAKQREINAEYKRLANTDDKKPAAGKNNGEVGIEYRTPEEGIEYVNARAIQPWSAPLDHLRFKRDELGYSLSLSERQQVRDLGAQEKAWEEKWAAGHTDTDVPTGRRSRFEFYADQYGQGGLSSEIYHAKREIGSLYDSNYRLISANARDMARRAIPAIMRRRADLLADRPTFSRAGQAAIDAELADLEYMALYYQRMAEGENVARTMPGRIEHQRMLATAKEVAASLGEKVVLYEAPGDIEDANYNRKVRKQRSYGWYNPNDGTIHINVGRHRNAREIVKTVLHEIVGHKTIEQIMGSKRFARLIDEIWNHAGKKVRAKIAEKMRKNGWDFREATKEYLGEIAEEVHTKGYGTLEAEKKTIWQRVKAKIQDFLNRILEGLKIPARIRLSENDLSYMMWKLYKHKERKAAGKPAEGDIFDKAEEIVRREQWERDGNSMEIAARDGGDNKTMAERAREVMEQPAIEIVPHDYSKEELKRVYANLPAVEKDGRQIHFYHSAFGKNYRPDGNFAKVIPQLDAILDSSKFAYSEMERGGGEIRRDGTTHKQHTDIVSRDNYVGKALIDGEEYFVRFNVQNKKKESGVHSTMVTSVDVYKNTSTIEAIPTIHGGNLDYRGITDAKLREFFESAKKYPENLNDYLRSAENTSDDPEAGLHFRDGDDMQNMTIEEQTLKLSVMLADRHSGDVAVRDAAVEALGKTLGNIRKAMAVQHTYDYNTVRSLGAVADILISSGTFLPEGPGEVKRLYGIMKRGIGHAYTDDAGVEHVTQSEKDYNAAVESLMDLFVSNQLKLSGKFLDEVMKIRGSKVNARGVEVMGDLDVEGQIMVRGMKDYMNMDVQAIHDRIDTLDDIIANGNDAASMNAAAEKMGLELAEQYVAEVSDRVAQEKVMRDQLRDMTSQWAPSMSGDARKAYTEQKRALRESIRKIRIERAEAMRWKNRGYFSSKSSASCMVGSFCRLRSTSSSDTSAMMMGLSSSG